MRPVQACKTTANNSLWFKQKHSNDEIIHSVVLIMRPQQRLNFVYEHLRFALCVPFWRIRVRARIFSYKRNHKRAHRLAHLYSHFINIIFLQSAALSGPHDAFKKKTTTRSILIHAWMYRHMLNRDRFLSIHTNSLVSIIMNNVVFFCLRCAVFL